MVLFFKKNAIADDIYFSEISPFTVAPRHLRKNGVMVLNGVVAKNQPLITRTGITFFHPRAACTAAIRSYVLALTASAALASQRDTIIDVHPCRMLHRLGFYERRVFNDAEHLIQIHNIRHAIVRIGSQLLNCCEQLGAADQVLIHLCSPS